MVKWHYLALLPFGGTGRFAGEIEHDSGRAPDVAQNATRHFLNRLQKI